MDPADLPASPEITPGVQARKGLQAVNLFPAGEYLFGKKGKNLVKFPVDALRICPVQIKLYDTPSGEHFLTAFPVHDIPRQIEDMAADVVERADTIIYRLVPASPEISHKIQIGDDTVLLLYKGFGACLFHAVCPGKRGNFRLHIFLQAKVHEAFVFLLAILR